jgi:AraC-like DNA-binding protein
MSMTRNADIAPWQTSLNDKLCHFPLYSECDDRRTRTARHRQLGVELNLTRQGQGHLEIDGEHHAVQSGVLMVIAPQCSHQLIVHSSRPYVRSVLCIAPTKEGSALEQAMLEVMSEPIFAQPAMLRLSTAEMNTLNERWRQIVWESQLQGPWWKQSSLLLAMESLISVARWLRAGRAQASEHAESHERSDAPADLAQQVAAYIQSHLADDLSAAHLAEQFHVSREHLSRLMSRTYGVALHRFVMAQRIAQAKKLLAQQPDEPLLNIALETGFQSHAHFSRVFRQMEGISPGAYRDMVAGV